MQWEVPADRVSKPRHLHLWVACQPHCADGCQCSSDAAVRVCSVCHPASAGGRSSRHVGQVAADRVCVLPAQIACVSTALTKRSEALANSCPLIASVFGKWRARCWSVHGSKPTTATPAACACATRSTARSTMLIGIAGDFC